MPYTPCLSQTKGTINYIQTINDGMPGSPRTVNYIISFVGNKSIEYPVKKAYQSTNETVSESDVRTIKNIISDGGKIPFVFKDFINNDLIFSENIFMKQYLLKDILQNFSWKINSATKTISGYLCRNATTNFRGRLYEAWFTEDVPIQNGPWKFCGLPGLIISVKDSQGIYNFELSGINLRQEFDINLVNIPKEYLTEKRLTYFEFKEILKSKKEEYKTKSRIVNNENGYSSTRTITLPDRIELY